jgi:hypothetical protein
VTVHKFFRNATPVRGHDVKSGLSRFGKGCALSQINHEMTKNWCEKAATTLLFTRRVPNLSLGVAKQAGMRMHRDRHKLTDGVGFQSFERVSM